MLLTRVLLALLLSAFAASTHAATDEFPLACTGADQQASAETVRKYLEWPGYLLAKYRSGGGGFIADIRELTVTEPKTLPLTVALVEGANWQQKYGIGWGLGRAVVLCEITRPEYAAHIQEEIVRIGDPNVTVAFLDATKDPVTASIGVGTLAIGNTPASVGTGDARFSYGSAFSGVVTANPLLLLSLGSAGGGGGNSVVLGRSVSPRTP